MEYALKLLPLVLALIVIFGFIRPISSKHFIIRGALVFLVVINLVFSYLYSVFRLTPAELGFSKTISLCIEGAVYGVNFLCAFALLRLMLYLLLRLFRCTRASLFVLSSSSALAAVFLLSVLVTSLGIICGDIPAEIKKYEIYVRDLDREHSGFLIVQLSDLHINAVTEASEVSDIVRRVNALSPDLIVITGDFIDGRVEDVGFMAGELFSLKAKYGIYAVSGNHELYWGYEDWLKYLSSGGIVFLENRSVLIKDDEGRGIIYLCGVTDKKAALYGAPAPDPVRALEGTYREYPVIALSHRPKYAVSFKDRAALTLSGHTHGGLMPGLELLAALTNQGMIHDLYEIGDEKVIVSRGTRISMAGPLRLFNRAQIVAAELRAAD